MTTFTHKCVTCACALRKKVNSRQTEKGSSETIREDTILNDKNFFLKKNMELTDDWIIGFVDGDGCFKIVKTSSNEKRYCFVVSQDKRSVDVLYALKQKFGCGSVNKAGGNMREYRVTKKEELAKVILPFFERHPLKTEKWRDFRLFFVEMTGREPSAKLVRKHK